MTDLFRRHCFLLLFLGLLAVYIPTCFTNHTSIDVLSADYLSWHVANTGVPWFGHAVTLPGWHFGHPLWVLPTSDGHWVITRSPGVVAASVPAYLLASLLGVGGFGILPACLTAAVCVAAGMALLCRALASLVRRRTAVAATLMLALTTPVWSVAAIGMWTHTVVILGLGGFAWAVTRQRWLTAGLLGGIAVFARLHTSVMVAIVGCWLAIRRRNLSIALKVGVTSGLCLLLAMVWSKWMYDSWNPAGGYSFTGGTTKALKASGSSVFQEMAGMLISPSRGLLVWTPALFIFLPAWLRGWRSTPDWVRALAVAGIVYLVIQVRLEPRFDGGDGFWGYRLQLETLLCLVPLCVANVHLMRNWQRALLWPLIGYQFAVISFGALPSTYPGYQAPNSWSPNDFFRLAGDRPGLWAWLSLCVLVGMVASVVNYRRRPIPLVGAIIEGDD